MTVIDWFWTGGNNRADGLYGPPRGVSWAKRAAYLLGWYSGLSERR